MSSDPPTPTDADADDDEAQWRTADEAKPNLDAAVAHLSKELEWMGLSRLAVDDAAAAAAAADQEVLRAVIGAAYELIGAIRQLQHSKRQRDDHAQQLIHDLQRCQWLVERQKEQCGRRERDAADAREKERQAGVRLRCAESQLKKKTEQHRQLARETQLKDNQWRHAIKRKDIEIERLQQQVIKLLDARRGVAGVVEMDVRGCLPPATAAMMSTSGGGTGGVGGRKRWDRIDESRSQRVIEDKWKLVVVGLEKEIHALRSDYQRLADMAGAFLDRVPRRRQHEASIPHNVKEWVQLPLSLIGPQLEDIFKALGDQQQHEHSIDVGDVEKPLADESDGERRRDEWAPAGSGHERNGDAEIECWSHLEPAATDWLFSLTKDAVNESTGNVTTGRHASDTNQPTKWDTAARGSPERRLRPSLDDEEAPGSRASAARIALDGSSTADSRRPALGGHGAPSDGVTSQPIHRATGQGSLVAGSGVSGRRDATDAGAPSSPVGAVRRSCRSVDEPIAAKVLFPH